MSPKVANSSTCLRHDGASPCCGGTPHQPHHHHHAPLHAFEEEGDRQQQPTAMLVEQLQSELEQLRQSTKLALEHSWKEVESLQQRCASETERAHRLERELEETRAREENWRIKYEETKSDLMTSEAALQHRASLADSSATNDGGLTCDEGPEHPGAGRRASFRERRDSWAIKNAWSVFGGGGGRKSARQNSEHSGSHHSNPHDCRGVEMLKSFQVSCEDWEKFLESEDESPIVGDFSASFRRHDDPQQRHQRRGSSHLSSSDREMEEAGEGDEGGESGTGAGAINRMINPWLNLRSALDNKNETHRRELEETKQRLESSLAALQVEKDTVIAELQKQVSDRDSIVQIEQQKDAATIAELRKQITDRDSVITEMDRIASAQEDDLHYVAEELDKLKDAFTEREAKLGQEVDGLKGRVREKKVIIKKQVKKYQECQEYIKELTAELERLYREQDDREEAGPTE